MDKSKRILGLAVGEWIAISIGIAGSFVMSVIIAGIAYGKSVEKIENLENKNKSIREMLNRFEDKVIDRLDKIDDKIFNIQQSRINSRRTRSQ